MIKIQRILMNSTMLGLKSHIHRVSDRCNIMDLNSIKCYSVYRSYKIASAVET